jgi:hypothetical protein
MLYSSGTTGRLKGVRPAARRAADNTCCATDIRTTFGFSADTVFINPGPFYHVAPLRMMMSVHRGGTVVGFRKFDAKWSCARSSIIGHADLRADDVQPDAGSAQIRRHRRLEHAFAIHGAAPCPIGIRQRCCRGGDP